MMIIPTHEDYTLKVSMIRLMSDGKASPNKQQTSQKTKVGWHYKDWHSKAEKAKFNAIKVSDHTLVTKSWDTFPNITNPALRLHKYYQSFLLNERLTMGHWPDSKTT